MTLVGYWPLTEDSDDALDYSGNENHGTVNGATQGADGILGTTAYDFASSNSDHVSIPSYSFSAVNGDGFTVSAWINPDFGSLDGNNRGIVSWHSDGSNNWRIRWDSTSQWQWGWSNTNLTVDIGHSAGEWHHMVMTVEADGSYLAGYWDAEEVISATGLDNATGTSELQIGNDVIGSYYFDGKISNVRLYDRTLTPHEIQYLYQVSQQGYALTEEL